jgi:two-component system, OmpR family, alkaline phosphatase synthesis response regulator PhoP
MTAATSSMPSLPRILIVDANDADIARYKAYLSHIECHIDTVTESAAALERIREFSPHLILLDSMIGKGDGFYICTKLKNDLSIMRTMIVMVIALNELGDIERAVSAGTDDFISKPATQNELLNRVVNLLKLQDLQQ